MQLLVQNEIEQLRSEETDLFRQRKGYPSKIKIKGMPEQIRYNQLDGQSKHFKNIIKMICYRSEAAFANLLAHYYKKSVNEIRAVVKKIINPNIDLQLDYENEQLYVIL